MTTQVPPLYSSQPPVISEWQQQQYAAASAPPMYPQQLPSMEGTTQWAPPPSYGEAAGQPYPQPNAQTYAQNYAQPAPATAAYTDPNPADSARRADGAAKPIFSWSAALIAGSVSLLVTYAHDVPSPRAIGISLLVGAIFGFLGARERTIKVVHRIYPPMIDSGYWGLYYPAPVTTRRWVFFSGQNNYFSNWGWSNFFNRRPPGMGGNSSGASYSSSSSTFSLDPLPQSRSSSTYSNNSSASPQPVRSSVSGLRSNYGPTHTGTGAPLLGAAAARASRSTDNLLRPSDSTWSSPFSHGSSTQEHAQADRRDRPSDPSVAFSSRFPSESGRASVDSRRRQDS